MLRIDLHSHSTESPDGGITADQYRRLLDGGRLDQIAITDHNSINLAIQLSNELGSSVIVGEEINTTQGELVGLFLKKAVAAGLSALATAKAIRRQGGLVYVPHPFETVRNGLSVGALDEIANYVDIMEVHNGRAVFQNRSKLARTWAQRHHVVMAASSDAHTLRGLGHTYTKAKEPLTATNVKTALGHGQLIANWPPLTSLLAPKFNRLRKRLGQTK